MVLIHTNTNNHKYRKFRSHEGFNIVPALKNYRCYHLINKATKANLYSNTVKFCHSYINQTTVTSEDRIVYAINLLSCTLGDVPSATYHYQMDAIKSLQESLPK